MSTENHINESILSDEIKEHQKKNRIDHMKYMPDMEVLESDILDKVLNYVENYNYETYTEEDVKILHQYMNQLLEKEGAEIDAFYYCPHHPVHGIGAYKKVCNCRKPGTGMFEMAEKDFPVDRAASYMIGDKLLDTEAGQKFGVTSILVGTGYGAELHKEQQENGEKPPYVHYAADLEQAAQWILERK